MSINLISLESEAKSLIEMNKDLRGGYLEVNAVTGNLIEPPSFSDPSTLPDRASF